MQQAARSVQLLWKIKANNFDAEWKSICTHAHTCSHLVSVVFWKKKCSQHACFCRRNWIPDMELHTSNLVWKPYPNSISITAPTECVAYARHTHTHTHTDTQKRERERADSNEMKWRFRINSSPYFQSTMEMGNNKQNVNQIWSRMTHIPIRLSCHVRFFFSTKSINTKGLMLFNIINTYAMHLNNNANKTI